MPKNKSMAYLVKETLYQQQCFGQSKHKQKIDQHTHNPDGIFSKSTMKTYIKHCTAFATWAKATYNCKNLSDAFPYVKDYIKMRLEKGLSAWTVKTEVSAICKLYHISARDLDIKTPPRERANINRSRVERNHDNHFSPTKNQTIIDFCRGTGLRRHELLAVCPQDIYTRGNKTWVHVEQGKGGKAREIEVLSGYQQHILDCARNSPGEKTIFGKKEAKYRMDIHSYRAEYAKNMYLQHARPLESLSRAEKYYCRNDKCGQVYDRRAMLIASQYLGHNRINVIASNYLY